MLVVLAQLGWMARPRGTGAYQPVELREQELGDSRLIAGRVSSGLRVELTERAYIGSSSGFWGAVSAPPRAVVWSLRLIDGVQVIDLPPESVRDVADVVRSPDITTFEQLNAVRDRLSVHRTGERGYTVRLRAGDGGGGFEIMWRARVQQDGSVAVRRCAAHTYLGDISLWRHALRWGGGGHPAMLDSALRDERRAAGSEPAPARMAP